MASVYFQVAVMVLMHWGGSLGKDNNPCPPGIAQFKCVMNPCQFATCSAYPKAECKANYCGGCNAEFYNAEGRKVNCDESDPCPPGISQVKCVMNPCQFATCSAHPKAECKANYCGGCNAEFYSAGEKVNCEDTSLNESVPCPPGVARVECFDTCQTSTCPSHPKAECKTGNCGSCSAVFYNTEGEKVSCEALKLAAISEPLAGTGSTKAFNISTMLVIMLFKACLNNNFC